MQAAKSLYHPIVTKQLIAVRKHWQKQLSPQQQAEGGQEMLSGALMPAIQRECLLRGILSPLWALHLRFPWNQHMEDSSGA